MERIDMKNIKLSIIIPHYNSEESLLKLLRTIPQNEEVEIIIIDDNSTISLNNLYSFISNNPLKNISLHKNSSNNKGAGASRNIGLKYAVGKWLLFADSDDFFVDGWYQNAEKYLESSWDIVYFCPTSLNLLTNQTSSRHLLYKELVENYIDRHTCQSLLELKYYFCTPWSKLIRRSIVEKNSLRFDEVLASNDIMFITKCAFHSNNIQADKNIIYCVTRGGQSLTATRDKKIFMTRIDVFVNRYLFLREHLTENEFKKLHMDRYALGKLVDVIIDKWGILTFIEVLEIFKNYDIKIWDIGLFNPYTLFHKVKIGLAWWRDIKKNRQ